MTRQDTTDPEHGDAVVRVLDQIPTLIGGILVLATLAPITVIVCGLGGWLPVIVGLIEVGVAARPRRSVPWVLRAMVGLFGAVTLVYGVLTVTQWQ